MPPSERGGNTVPLACRSLGSGPPLIVLHGFLGSGRNWQNIARRLAARHRCLLVDLRNHGDSPWAPEMDYEVMAADLRAFMDDRHLVRASLLGHSMGGKVAMTFALRHCDRVERLIVVDIAPVRYRRSLEGLLDAMLAVDLSRFRRRGEVDRALAGSVPDPSLRGFLLQNLAVRDDRLVWRCNLPVLRRHLSEITGFPEALCGRRCDRPTLFLRGARSDYVREEHFGVIREHFPNARIETVASAGHWLHAERPDETVRHVGAFLDEA